MTDGGRGWDSAYRGAPPPWEIGRAQPAVTRLADAGRFKGRVLDAGCGTGENAIELAARGFETWGIDGAPTAIRIARSKAEERGLSVTFMVADALQLDRLGQVFDTVLDCGLFHTFPDEDRARYVQSLASVIVPMGTLHVLCFSDREPWGGGPRRVSQAELREAFADGWRVVSVQPESFDTLIHAQGAHAWLATMERKSIEPGSGGPGVPFDMAQPVPT